MATVELPEDQWVKVITVLKYAASNFSVEYGVISDSIILQILLQEPEGGWLDDPFDSGPNG